MYTDKTFIQTKKTFTDKTKNMTVIEIQFVLYN